MFNSISNVGQVSSTYTSSIPSTETTEDDNNVGIFNYTSSSVSTADDNVDISSGPTTSNEPISWGEDYESAMAQASAEGKQVIIIFGRPSCGNCTRTQNNANDSAEVRGLINDNYIAVHVNIDTPEGLAAFYQYRDELPEIPAGKMTLPLTCVVDPSEPGTSSIFSTKTQTAANLVSMLQQGIEGKSAPNGNNSTGASHSASSGYASGFNLSINRNEFLLGMSSDVLSSVIANISESNDSVESDHTETGDINTTEYFPNITTNTSATSNTNTTSTPITY